MTVRLGSFLLVALAAAAQEPEEWCRAETFVHETNFQVGEITSAEGKFAAGSEVLVGHRFEGRACVWYQPAEEAETVGWIAESHLKVKTPQPANESWTGDWNDRGQNWLDIAALADRKELHIAGHARWYGDNEVIHFGRVNGDIVPGVAHLSVTEGLCSVHAQVMGRYLIAEDNTRCGGVSVRFDGVYQKRSMLVGYVPQVREGLVVGSNVDLGQFTWTRLSQFPIAQELQEKLKPAIGFKGEDAVAFGKAHPLQLTEAEARSLTMGMWNAVFGRVAGQFDKAKAEGVPAFRELPSNVQTVICDLSVTFGDNFGAEDLQRWGSDPELWKLLTHGAWPDAVEELRAKAEHLRRNFPHTLGDRLDREADLLSKKD